MGVPQSQRCGVGSILSQGWPVPTSLPLFLSISLFPADGQATSTSSLETDLQGGPPLVLFSAGPPPSHVAAVVLNGFEHSRLVEKRQHRAGALRDKELQESSLMDAGRLSLVSFPPQGGNSAQTVLTICLPDAGVVKYDPVLRRNWLELIDLVNLQIRVAQQVLQGAAGQDVSVVQVLQKHEDQGDVLKEAGTQGAECQALQDCLGTSAAKIPRSTWPHLCWSNVVEQVLAEIEAKLEYTWRAVDRSQDAALWKLRVIEELEEMRLLPRRCQTFESWSSWISGLKAGTDVFASAVASQKNERTAIAAAEASELTQGSPSSSSASTSASSTSASASASSTAFASSSVSASASSPPSLPPSTSSAGAALPAGVMGNGSVPDDNCRWTIPKKRKELPVPTNVGQRRRWSL
ncbi:unnamed protein product [Sympodiomycopsis kandeliae]